MYSMTDIDAHSILLALHRVATCSQHVWSVLMAHAVVNSKLHLDVDDGDFTSQTLVHLQMWKM